MSGGLVVIGVGSELRGDDAAGLAVIRALQGRLPPRVVLHEQDGDPAELIEAWDGAAAAWVVDAVRSADPPGTVHRFDLPAELPHGQTHASSHALGLGEAVALGCALSRMPAQLTVLGITGHSFDLGTGMSCAVERAARRLSTMLVTELYPAA